MKKLVILGAGTAGTMMLNKLSSKLNKNEWSITIVDQDEYHYYQPGFLFIPFEIYTEEDVIKPKADFVPPGVELVFSGIEKVGAEENKVFLEGGHKQKTGGFPRPLEYPHLSGAARLDVGQD